MNELRKLGLIEFIASPVVTGGVLHGSFARQGLVIESEQTHSSTEQMKGLCAGTWHMASTAFDNVLAWSGREGHEIVAIAPAAQGVFLPVIVRPEIRSWDDLRGKPLAVDAVDTAYALVLRRILQAHGLEMDNGDYSLVPAGAPPQRYESMAKGETFAAILNPPWDHRAVEDGMALFGDHREVLPDYPGAVYAVTRTFAEANRTWVTGFLKGLIDATGWLLDPATSDLAVRQMSAGEGGGEKPVRARLARVPRELTLNRDGLRVVLDLRVRFGMTPGLGSDLATYVDTSYAEEAMKTMR